MMRSGLLMLGVFLVVVGLIAYIIPVPARAASDASNAEVSIGGSAMLQQQIAVGAMLLGAALSILGIVLPDPAPPVQLARTPPAPARRIIYVRDEEDIRKR